ncbi:response regulator receiver domain protein [Leptospira broomii serovar Hurstbridge str. 5399]|uniref:Response regulator receiver domain protein n=1 Tax=Leptospira broomii serovar Hurstbridge str. 5399 TaxID=1049789 RepID=T0F6M1_9LEPT|nr:response regulator [Leptospira broomii]EQA43546.1 response regulator receiver domain protein [Leptospira broomii serovar Hurstbridge str. 5399]
MFQNWILLVEDNPDDEELTLRALRKTRIDNRIEVARDGEEALDLLFGKEGIRSSIDANAMPQVVLLDLNLPKIDGKEVLRQIRSREISKSLPVIILTSYKEQKDLLQYYSSGANSCLVKPVDTKKFVEAINRLGLHWLVINEQTSEKG